MGLIDLNGFAGYFGTPNLKRVSRYGLDPGDTMDQVGAPGKSGKETSSHRVRTLIFPMSYEGVFVLKEKEREECWKESEWLAFKVPAAKYSMPDSYGSGDLYSMWSLPHSGTRLYCSR